jgi:hypothetical protein
VLADAGVPVTEDEVVTSAQAAAVLLAAHCPDRGRCSWSAARGLRVAVEEAGFTVVASADDTPVAVVQGFDRSVGYEQLAEAVLAVRAGAVWVASNTDSTIPGPRGLLPGNGALVAAVSVATGATPLVAGKPDGALHAESVRRSEPAGRWSSATGSTRHRGGDPGRHRQPARSDRCLHRRAGARSARGNTANLRVDRPARAARGASADRGQRRRSDLRRRARGRRRRVARGVRGRQLDCRSARRVRRELGEHRRRAAAATRIVGAAAGKLAEGRGLVGL